MPAVLVQGHCYAELAVSSLAETETIASTHCAYPRRDGQAEYAWLALVEYQDGIPQTVIHPSINLARRRATTLIKTNALPLSQAATDRTGIILMERTV